MSIKSKVLAAAATLTLLGGARRGQRAHSSAQRGHAVVRPLLHRHLQPRVRHAPPPELRARRAAPGRPRSTSRSSCTAPATATRRKTSPSPSRARSSDFLRAPSAGVRRCAEPALLGTTRAFEIEYSPYGVNSGLCVGVGEHRRPTARRSSLQPCGASAKTVWVVDSPTDRSRRRLRAADQRLGHQLLAPVRAALPGQLVPDRHAAPAAQHARRCSSTPTTVPCSTTSCGAPTSASCGNSWPDP